MTWLCSAALLALVAHDARAIEPLAHRRALLQSADAGSLDQQQAYAVAWDEMFKSGETVIGSTYCADAKTALAGGCPPVVVEETDLALDVNVTKPDAPLEAYGVFTFMKEQVKELMASLDEVQVRNVIVQ